MASLTKTSENDCASGLGRLCTESGQLLRAAFFAGI